MPTYRPPQQILFSPVTSFYQGKAIRQSLAAGEQDIEFKSLQIKAAKQELANAPSKRAQAKELALLRKEELELSIAEKVRNGETDDMQFAADLIAPILLTYNDESGENDETEDQAIGNFNVRMQDVIKKLPESKQQEWLDAAGSDHVFDHNEAFNIGLSIRSFSDLMNQQVAENPFAKINPKDFTQESIDEFQRTGDFAVLQRAPTEDADVDFEPPNKAEREHADQLVEKSDKLSDLKSRDKNIARDIIASEIRQLQAAGFPLDEASTMAVANIEQKLKEVPGFFSSYQELDLNAGGLADNEYVVNGIIYIRNADGRIRAKD